MDWKSHIYFGIGFLIALFLINWKFKFLQFNFLDYLFFIPLVIFMMISPDLDHQMSMPRTIATILLLIISIYLILTGKLYVGVGVIALVIIMFILKFISGFKHREHIHSIAFVLLLSVLFFLFVKRDIILSVILFVAGFSHLLADYIHSTMRGTNVKGIMNPLKLW